MHRPQNVQRSAVFIAMRLYIVGISCIIVYISNDEIIVSLIYVLHDKL